MSILKFPATSDRLREAGYQYDNDSFCRSCEAPIEWWITPNGAKMPMSVLKTATVQHATADVRQPHFVDCPDAAKFRKKK